MINGGFVLGFILGGVLMSLVSCAYFSRMYMDKIKKLIKSITCKQSVTDDTMEDLINQKEILSDKNKDLLDDNFGLESEVDWCIRIIKSKNLLIKNLGDEIDKVKKENKRLYDNNRRLVGELLDKKIKG